MCPPAKLTGELKTIIFNEEKRQKTVDEKMCLKSHLSLFFCSVTKEVVSDKCSCFPTHCIQKERAALNITVGRKYSTSFSPLHLHYISSASWYMCCSSKAVRCWQGWCRLPRTHMLLFPTTSPIPILGSHRHTMNQASSVICLTSPERKLPNQCQTDRFSKCNRCAAACACPAEVVGTCGKSGV